jgi:hypothetical protein
LKEATMGEAAAVEVQGSGQRLHELLSLHGRDPGVGEVRRLATVAVAGVDAEHAKVLGRQVADWSLERMGDDLRQAFDVDVFELLARGWTQLRGLRRAVQASVGPPPSAQAVALLQHELEARVEPRLVLQVGGLDWADVQLALVLKLRVEAAQLHFFDGALVELKLAKPTGSVALQCEGHEVAAAKRSLTLKPAYRFDPPLRWPENAPAAAA